MKTWLNVALVCSAVMGSLTSHPVWAEVLDEIEITFHCNYTGELSEPTSITRFASTQEAIDVVRDIVRHQGLPQNFAVNVGAVDNAMAVIHGRDRYIIYNEYFMRDTRMRTGNGWAPISIMAHEVGHHLSGHTITGEGSQPRIELEADRFSGFVLQRMGASLEDARTAMEFYGTESATVTHPARRDRLAAITNGWSEACSQDSGCDDGAFDLDDEEETIAQKKTKPHKQGKDSCEYALDDECDEPDYCDAGTDTTDCSSPPPSGPMYCCDQMGRKWCQIVVNPGPEGTPCYCQGVPGSGFMCQ